MEEILKKFVGKEIDIAFGSTATVRGVVKEIRGGLLFLEDEDSRTACVQIDKIAVVWESDDTHGKPGFVN